ncbi:Phage portal protein [Streptococcus pyogenes]|nr:Phage portal protein [Streptococcus pyogenes]
MSHLLIWGNAYVQIIRDKSGMVSLLLKQKASVLIRKLLLIIWQRMP